MLTATTTATAATPRAISAGFISLAATPPATTADAPPDWPPACCVDFVWTAFAGACGAFGMAVLCAKAMLAAKNVPTTRLALRINPPPPPPRFPAQCDTGADGPPGDSLDMLASTTTAATPTAIITPGDLRICATPPATAV